MILRKSSFIVDFLFQYQHVEFLKFSTDWDPFNFFFKLRISYVFKMDLLLLFHVT